MYSLLFSIVTSPATIHPPPHFAYCTVTYTRTPLCPPTPPTQVKRVREKSQQIRDTNKDLAGRNVEMEPKFEEVKSELLEKTSELNEVKEEYDKRFMELSKS